MKFFYWDPKDDPREPEYWLSRPPLQEVFLWYNICSV